MESADLRASYAGVGYWAVSLPYDMTVRVGEKNVSVVGRGEIDELLPLVFVIENGDEMGLLIGGHIFAHAAEDHGANKRRSALEDRELIVSGANV